MNLFCPICSEPQLKTDNIVSTQCGHIYHRNCIENWLKTSSKSCPTCRTGTNSCNLIKLYFEVDDSKEASVFDEILKKNDEISEKLKFLKHEKEKQQQKIKSLEQELVESSKKNKKYELQKQLDDKALAEFASLFKDLEQRIVKLIARFDVDKENLKIASKIYLNNQSKSVPTRGSLKRTNTSSCNQMNKKPTGISSKSVPTEKQEGESAWINVDIHKLKNTVIEIKIERHTPFGKLMEAYCNLKCWPLDLMGQLQFRFNGRLIDGNDTPTSLNMEEGDTISVFLCIPPVHVPIIPVLKLNMW